MSDPLSPLPGFASVAIDACWKRIGVWGDSSCAELAHAIHCRNCSTYSQAARKLLDRELPANYAKEWVGHLARKEPAVMDDVRTIIIFRVGAEWLGLPAGILESVSDLRPIHSLPHGRGAIVLGLANIRGELLVCLSLREALGIEPGSPAHPDRKQSGPGRFLVVGQGGDRLVLPVDEVHGLHRFSSREVRKAPATVLKGAAAHTQGLLSWREGSLGILDEKLLFRTLDQCLS